GLYVAKIRLDGGRAFVTVSGRASSMPRPPVPRALSAACFFACLALAALLVLVYGTLVVSAFTAVFPTNLTFTVRHFEFVATGTNGDALRNTLTFSVVAAAFSAVFALFAGWLVQRGTWPGRGALRVGFVTPFVRAVTTLSVVIFLFTPATTVATIRIYQLVNDLNWGGATAFTVADIGMAIVALVIFAALARGRIALGAARA